MTSTSASDPPATEVTSGEVSTAIPLSMAAERPGVRSLILLGLMVAPNVVWILANRSVWNSDTSYYAIHALSLFETLITDPGSWWHRLITISPTKPPLLAWIGQFLVPIGRLAGGMDQALLLIPLLAQTGGLFLLYRAFRSHVESRYALIGCLCVASAPIVVQIGNQHYAQPLQFFGVAWFLFILARARDWDPATTIVQLASASAFALGAMMSSPAYCVIPGTLAVGIAWTRRRVPLEPGWRHARLVFLGLVLTVPVVGWYATNLDSAMDYARLGFGFTFAAEVEGGYLAKLRYWIGLVTTGFRMTAFLAVGAVTVIAWRAVSNARAVTPHRMAALAAGAQLVLVLGLFATSAHQTYRYVLPLAPYLATLGVIGLALLRTPAISGLVAAVLAVQLVSVNVTAWGDAGARQERALYLRALDAMTEVTAGETGGTVLLATGQVSIFSLDLTYHAAKRARDFHAIPQYRAVEFIFTGPDRPDLAAMWERIVETPPTYVVTVNGEIREATRNEYRGQQVPEGSWLSVILMSNDIADRIATSGRYRPVPSDAPPAIEIHRLVDGGTSSSPVRPPPSNGRQ